MPQRKGQFIINHLRFNLKIPEEVIGKYLFNMTDEDLAQLEHEYRLYVIKEIHKPERQARMEDLMMVSRNVKTVSDIMNEMMEDDEKDGR